MKILIGLFRNHRFPEEIIQYAVWLYFVFPLSFRDVELLLHQRGIAVTHESFDTVIISSLQYCAQVILQK